MNMASEGSDLEAHLDQFTCVKSGVDEGVVIAARKTVHMPLKASLARLLHNARKHGSVVAISQYRRGPRRSTFACCFGEV